MCKKLPLKKVFPFFVHIFLLIILAANAQAGEIPDVVETVTGEDGSLWERVNQPGFGSEDNTSVVAMAEYQERLYVMTRNEVEGVEVWRTSGTGWEQVQFPGGETNGIYGNTWINNLWGGMSVFQGKLYFGFSSGLQGSVLKSTGCEIWRYDGANWEMVISDKKDTEESGTIKTISGCADEDDGITAQITDTAKSWTEDEWADGVLQITSGNGKYRRFDIISNTSDTLTVQQNEVAGNVDSEYTICESKHYSNPFPVYEYDLGEIRAGDSYEIGLGNDENGFGDYWNKTITKMQLFDNKLFVSTGLNYEYGAQVWYTEDGDNWTVTEPTNSFGNFHTKTGYPDSKKPVSTSISSLGSSSVSGTEVLYAGGAGASGATSEVDLGGCSRVAKLTDTGWELIVDANVDENDTGTNENGFGDGMGCSLTTGNFLPWSLTSFKDKLMAGIQTLVGARVLYSTNGSSEDGSWFYSVGGNGTLPPGFDDIINGGIPTMHQNVAVNLFPFEDYLYAGLVATYAPTMGATTEYLTGSHIWKTSDGIAWQQVTVNGFGDDYVIGFEGFTTFANTFYVSASKGASSTTEGLGGAEIFRLVDPIDVCPALPEAFEGLVSDNDVTVKKVSVEEWEEGSNLYYAFEPKKTDPKIGLILFPGAYVDPIAYAPPAHTIAAEGFLTVLIQVKGGLSLGKNLTRADRVMSDYPGIEKWIVGGHSMGGSGACSYAKDFTENVVGVVLWAAYPTETFRIDDKDLKAISIYGSKNLNIERFPASAEHLPPNTPFVIIEGGNHYQFGWYDASLCPEVMDRTPADITMEEQQAQIIQSTLDFLEQFDISTTTTIPTPSCPAELLYGENSEEAELLRNLRDTIISTTPEGQELIKLYYQWSPAIVKALQDDEELKEEGKTLTDGILLLIRGEKE